MRRPTSSRSGTTKRRILPHEKVDVAQDEAVLIDHLEREVHRHPQVLDGLDGLVRICEWP